MILYVNGDSHTAAAEAMTPYAFAEDESSLFYLGRAPHPTNLAVSWGKLLSLTLSTPFHYGCESGSSNSRIMRTTKDWLKQYHLNREKKLVIIQWSTWEREEWFDPATQLYIQVNASGVDHVPQSMQEKYRHYVMSVDWRQKTKEAHEDIWNFHLELASQEVPHIFFNGNNTFATIKDQKDWGTSYIGPYDPEMTFDAILRKNGFETVSPESYHFGKDGHSFFHRFMLKYIVDNKLI